MEFLDCPISLSYTTSFSAAEVDFPAPPTKVRPQTALPTYLTSASPSKDTFLPQSDLRLAVTDFEDFRTNNSTTPALLRQFAKASPDLSAAVFAALRMGISSEYVVMARNLDGTLNEDGTRLAQQLCRRFDYLGPTDGGFNAYPSLRSSAESLGKEIYIQGAMGLEVILNKARLPEGLQPISVQTIKWKYSGKRKVPYQVLGGEEINLDIPTFFYVSLDQDLMNPYAESPVQSAIQPILASQHFAQDLRRVFRRAVHPRIAAKINEELWRKSVPSHILQDSTLLGEEMAKTVASIKGVLDNLNPEDALINFDSLDLSYLTGGYTSMSDEYKTYETIMNGKVASGSKSMPVVLGHEAAGSTNIASTQSMLQVKAVEGTIQAKLNEMFSRALTLCVRLYGIDAVVEFEYAPVDLRPSLEVESFRAMKQSRIYEQLSLGQITDQEASLKLTGSLLPTGAQLLSGKMFKTQTNTISNPESNTSALNRTLNSDAPKGAKSQ